MVLKSLLSWRAIQICSTNEESTILDYSIVKEQIKNLLIFTLLIAASDLLGAVRDLSSPAEAHIKALRLPWRKTDEAE